MKKYKFILLLSGLLLSTDILEFKYAVLLAPFENPDNLQHLKIVPPYIREMKYLSIL